MDISLLQTIEEELASEGEDSRAELDEAFDRFERSQPQLADRIGGILNRPLDETALALGYFLSIAVWLAFERAFGARLRRVEPDELRAAEDALALEEELRAEHADEPLDIDDVMSIEQPGILAFIHEHVEAALDATARQEAGEEHEVDVDDVHLIYRSMLVQTLALSHAVEAEAGAVHAEMQA